MVTADDIMFIPETQVDVEDAARKLVRRRFKRENNPDIITGVRDSDIPIDPDDADAVEQAIADTNVNPVSFSVDLYSVDGGGFVAQLRKDTQ
jgi:hypothetical protein